MPISRLFALLAIVIALAAVTIWLLTLGSPALLVAALPAFLIAGVTLRWLSK